MGPAQNSRGLTFSRPPPPFVGVRGGGTGGAACRSSPHRAGAGLPSPTAGDLRPRLAPCLPSTLPGASPARAVAWRPMRRRRGRGAGGSRVAGSAGARKVVPGYRHLAPGLQRGAAHPACLRGTRRQPRSAAAPLPAGRGYRPAVTSGRAPVGGTTSGGVGACRLACPLSGHPGAALALPLPRTSAGHPSRLESLGQALGLAAEGPAAPSPCRWRAIRPGADAQHDLCFGRVSGERAGRGSPLPAQAEWDTPSVIPADPAPSRWGTCWGIRGGCGGEVRNTNDLRPVSGGEGGIRTHGRLAPTSVFETDAIDHSATSPRRVVRPYKRWQGQVQRPPRGAASRR